MGRIYLSLLLTALLSLFVLGLGIDHYVTRQEPHRPPQDFAPLVDVFTKLLPQLQGTDETILQKTNEIQALTGLHLTLVPAADWLLPEDLQQRLTTPPGLILESNQGPFLLRALPNAEHQLLRLALPEIPPNPHNADLTLTLAFYLGLALMMVAWLLPLTRRLSLLTRAAAQFGQGQLHTRIPGNRLSYIKDLEQNFNQMAARIDNLIAENRLLSSSLSHDLRTPLACFRFGLDCALDGDTLADKDACLNKMAADLDRMEAMLNAFLDFASFERQATQLKTQEIDLHALTRAQVEVCGPIASEQGLVLELKGEWQSAPLLGDPQWLERAVGNMLTNAIKYAETKIEVALQREACHWLIEIKDDGPGIPEEKRQQIFEPFTRVDQTRRDGAYGLGLAIVAKVVKWHQGEIKLCQQESAQGACFQMRLPAS